jgi:membrane fusion protein (multidrug efflux system)
VTAVDVTLRYPIELEAAEQVAVSPVAVSGFLSSVLVDVGDKVSAGQVIAMVDCREYAAQRAQAETAISRWQAQEEESRTQLNRLLSMENKLVAPAEIDRARAAHRVSEAQLADAQAKLSEATQRQGYCWLKSPFDGYVSERNLDPGAMVGPGGQPVVTIVKTRDVKVVASVTEQDATKVERGAEVDVVLHALPDKPLRGNVARLGRSLHPKTRTLAVEVDLANANETLLPGMTGRASIVIGKRENALLLPVTAILNLEEASYVYVVREKDGKQRAERVRVELGVDMGDWLEVTQGITAKDLVILVGRELVTDGTLVEVKPAVAKPPSTEEPAKRAPEPQQEAAARAPEPAPGERAEATAPGQQGAASGQQGAASGQQGAASVEPAARERSAKTSIVSAKAPATGVPASTPATAPKPAAPTPAVTPAAPAPSSPPNVAGAPPETAQTPAPTP